MLYEPIYIDIDLSSFQPNMQETKISDFKRKSNQPEHCEPKNCRSDNYQHTTFRNCQTSKCKPSKFQYPKSLYVELPEYRPENIQVKINKSGRVNINASKNNTINTTRNGQRKSTVHVDYSFDLPEYLVEDNMLNEVKTEFEFGKLIFNFPQKPVGVKMAINFDDSEDKCQGTDGEVSEVVSKMVDDIENKNEQEMVDFEIVKIVDTDGNSEIDVE